jgi:hypothetical protein
MGPGRVVPQEPVHQLLVEGVDIVPEEWQIPRDEVLGERTIEAFNGAVHAGRARVRVEVDKTECLARFFEPECELAPVVGLELGDRKGADLDNLLEEVRCRYRGMGTVRSGERESSLHVDCGQDVPFGAVDEPYHRIELHAPAVGATLFLPLSSALLVMPSASCVEGETGGSLQDPPLGEVADDPAHVRLRYRIPGAHEEDRELLLAEAGVARALFDDEPLDRGRYGTLSTPYRCRTLGVERLEVSV